MRFPRSVGLAVGIVFMALASQAGAQLANSSISGTVVGADGAGLPKVAVTLRNQASGLVRTTVTADNGSYAIAGVKPGIYEVIFESEGYPAVNRQDVELLVGQETRLGVTLNLAEIAEA